MIYAALCLVRTDKKKSTAFIEAVELEMTSVEETVARLIAKLVEMLRKGESL